MLNRMFFVDNPVVPINEDNILTEIERLEKDIENGIYPNLKLKDTNVKHLGSFVYRDEATRRFSDVIEVEEYTPYNKANGFYSDYYDKLVEFKKQGLEDEWDKVTKWGIPNERIMYWLTNNFKISVNSFEQENSMMYVSEIHGKKYDSQMMNENPNWIMELLSELDLNGQFSIKVFKINEEEEFNFNVSGEVSSNWEEKYPQEIIDKYSSDNKFHYLEYFEDRYEKFVYEFMIFAIPNEHQEIENYFIDNWKLVKNKLDKGKKINIYAGKGSQLYTLGSTGKGIGFVSEFKNVDNYLSKYPHMKNVMSDLNISGLIERDNFNNIEAFGKYFGKE